MARLLERLDTVARRATRRCWSRARAGRARSSSRAASTRAARGASGPFVAVNCAAFPETLLEAELFGHERGAFTGATKKRDGRFKAADGGTLLLDEVAEMPLPAQAKLLRVLQEGVVRAARHERVRARRRAHRVGDPPRSAPAIAEGLFREDLYYRLNVVGAAHPAAPRAPRRSAAARPPLAPPAPAAAGEPLPDVSLRAWQALSAYPFPGNVRELAHAVQHARALAPGGPIDLEHLPDDIARAWPSRRRAGAREIRPLAVVVKQAEREHILRALAVAGGKRARAAELLGISRKNLWEKLRAHGISDSDVDDPRSVTWRAAADARRRAADSVPRAARGSVNQKIEPWPARRAHADARRRTPRRAASPSRGRGRGPAA